MKKTPLKRRILSLMLCLGMILGMVPGLPIPAMAASDLLSSKP